MSIMDEACLAPTVDILIAGTALANGMGIATRNVEHFSRISELHVENWAI